MTEKSVSLIGHSHAVCLMDALGAWRDALKQDTDAKADGRYTEAFQGWFSNDLTDVDIQLQRHDPKDKEACFSVAAFPIFAGAGEQNLVRREVDQEGRGRLMDTPALQSYLARMKNSDIILSCLFGNEFARYIYINNLPAYDFAEVGSGTQLRLTDTDAQPIDREHILELLRPMVRKVVNVLRVMQHHLPGMKIVHLLPPPPLEEPEAASKQEIFKDALEKYGPLDKALRLKWYRSYCEVARRHLDRFGIGYLEPPQDVQTPDGFLKPEFAEGLTHGNAEYGQRIWQLVAQELKS